MHFICKEGDMLVFGRSSRVCCQVWDFSNALARFSVHFLETLPHMSHNREYLLV